MNFLHPWALHLLWLLPFLSFAFIVHHREKRKGLRRFADPDLLERLTGAAQKTHPFISALLSLIAVALLLLALAGPRWGSHYQEVHQKGVDIMVVLDVSPSMRVADVKPDRLERAKREIQDFIKNVRGDRVGLVVFSGAAFVQCPLTLDYGAVQMFLHSMEPGLVPVPGTDLGGAVQTAISAFDMDSRTDKVILLITDGEDNEQQGEDAARAAAAKGIKIFVFGIGDPSGGPIPMSGKSGGFEKDEAGNMILSKLDEAGLEKIASITGGDYVRSVAGDLDLDLLYFEGIKSKTEAQNLKGGKIKVYEERFYLFVIAAFVVLLFEALVRDVSRRQKSSLRQVTRGTRVLLGLIGCLFLSFIEPSSARAEQDPDTLYRQGRYAEAEKLYAKKDMDHPKDVRYRYNRGCASYQNSDFKGAMAAFASVLKRTEERERKFKAAFNAGNAAFKLGDFEGAKDFYAQAISLNPANEEVKRNFELTLRELAKKKKEEQKQQASGNQQQEKKDSPDKKGNEEEKGQDESDKGESKEKQKGSDQPQKQPQEKETPKQDSADKRSDEHPPPEKPSGKLETAQPLPERTEEQPKDRSPASVMARKKAEALLDNVKEDPSHLMKFRMSQSEQNRPSSGKDW
ncbi:MAG: VWA domain-containing protein [Deltaproteobacteria bacterium]|nr:VWA domain-containing protein [Deltaproteobacteria bacterium]